MKPCWNKQQFFRQFDSDTPLLLRPRPSLSYIIYSLSHSLTHSHTYRPRHTHTHIYIYCRTPCISDQLVARPLLGMIQHIEKKGRTSMAEVGFEPANSDGHKHDLYCLLKSLTTCIRGPGSSVGIATTTGWTVRERIPVGTRFSAPPDRPWGPPSHLYNGYRVLPGGKVRPGCAADHSPPSTAAVMEE